MNGKKRLKTTILLVSLLLAGLVVLTGCKKKTEPTAPAETKEAASAKIEQTTCPVMGGAINKNIFTEHKGKKVYFCCAGCVEKFKANPEKYLDRLPQFKN